MLKYLMVNKFLYPNGGSETYIFELGKQLEKMGNQVEYFGMEDSRNVVGNAVKSYTSNMDFHSGKLQKLLYPVKIIYSAEARKAIRKVLENFNPDVVHLNNFNFQITPSIIMEILKFKKQNGKKIKILYTAHDYQLVCPNHMMRCPKNDENCSRCLGGSFGNCVKGSCIHGSKLKSLLGAMEALLYRKLKTYKQIDTIICPSQFIQKQMEKNPDLKGRTVFLQNFCTESTDSIEMNEKKEYILYFGRYSKEKGVETLLNACRKLPEIPFIFAGKGPLEDQVNTIPNIENKGFLSPDELRPLISQAAFSIYPSQWYENCPFSIMESIQHGTPVLGADIGGIPELIDVGVTGELFESGNEMELEKKIQALWCDKLSQDKYHENCLKKNFVKLEAYSMHITNLICVEG